jgi:hypothetical protein
MAAIEFIPRWSFMRKSSLPVAISKEGNIIWKGRSLCISGVMRGTGRKLEAPQLYICADISSSSTEALNLHCERRKLISLIGVRFEVFTAVTMKNVVFWDVTTYGSCKNRRFEGT